jgi:hypothetical protein
VSVNRVQGKVRAQLWDSGSSAWIDAPGDATNGLKVQGPLTDTQLRASAVPVSGTFYQATQPVSLASAPTTAVTGPLTDTQLRASAVPVSLASAPTTAVTGPLTDAQLRATRVPVDPSGVTSPVSAASLPLPTGAATDSNLNTLVGSAGSSPPSLDTGASGVLGWLRKLYGAVTGTLTVDGSGHTQPVSGTFWQSTQPVSGTVTVANPTTNPETGLAKDATLTGGTAKSINRGGAKGATTAADVTSTAEGTDHQALDVQVYHGGTAKDPTAIRALTSADQVTVANSSIPVTDNSGSLTVDAPVGTPLFTRLSDGTSALTTSSGRLAVDASGVAVPITDNGGSLTVDGTVTANAGSGPFPVSDNAGSLTVDAVAGSFGATVTPLADATSTGNFTANGDSLVAAVTSGMTMWGAYVQGTYGTGATITFEASVDGGTTYSTALMQRIDALAVSAITSVALTANLTRFYHSPIPPGATHVRMRVSAWASPSGTINARISQRAMPVIPHVSVLQGTANPVQTQVGDGSNQATIIPRGTAEASTDKGISVVPLAAKLPTYQVATTEITSATATGVKENLTLWHANTVTKDVFITEIGVSVRVVQTAGTFAWELQFISAENGTPGGTTITAQPLNLGDAASGLTIRQVVTGAPVVAGQIFQHAAFPLPAAATPFDGSSIEATILFKAESPSEAITLRNGQSEGLRITQNIAATLTTAPIFTIYVRYIERA